MQTRSIVLAGIVLNFCIRLGFVWILFLSAGEVKSNWLMWTLLVIMSVILTRTLYRAYNVVRIILAVGKLD